MSLSRVIPHSDAGYIEVVLDGHADWMSAVQRIEMVAEAVETLGVDRILLDFERVEMHIAVVEAPEVARFFHIYANQVLNIAIIPAANQRANATIDAFVAGMRALGHHVEYLENRDGLNGWLNLPSKRLRRTG